jgi:hypothetical protein
MARPYRGTALAGTGCAAYTPDTNVEVGEPMIEMREGKDGVFSPVDEPLPYGLHEDPQEPYVAIVAPNLDKVSGRTFDSGTLGGQRAKRGLFVALASMGGGVLVIVVVVVAQSILKLLGVE